MEMLNAIVECERIAFRRAAKMRQRYTSVITKENDVFGMMYGKKRDRDRLGMQMMALDNENCQNALEAYVDLCDEGNRVLSMLNRTYTETSEDTNTYNEYLLDAVKSHKRIDAKKYSEGKNELEQGLLRLEYEVDVVTLEYERARRNFEISNSDFKKIKNDFENLDAELRALKKAHKILKFEKEILNLELGACKKIQGTLSGLVKRKIWEAEIRSNYLDDRDGTVTYNKATF